MYFGVGQNELPGEYGEPQTRSDQAQLQKIANEAVAPNPLGQKQAKARLLARQLRDGENMLREMLEKQRKEWKRQLESPPPKIAPNAEPGGPIYEQIFRDYGIEGFGGKKPK